MDVKWNYAPLGNPNKGKATCFPNSIKHSLFFLAILMLGNLHFKQHIIPLRSFFYPKNTGSDINFSPPLIYMLFPK